LRILLYLILQGSLQFLSVLYTTLLEYTSILYLELSSLAITIA
jgi:hypothetical protein